MIASQIQSIYCRTEFLTFEKWSHCWSIIRKEFSIMLCMKIMSIVWIEKLLCIHFDPNEWDEQNPLSNSFCAYSMHIHIWIFESTVTAQLRTTLVITIRIMCVSVCLKICAYTCLHSTECLPPFHWFKSTLTNYKGA